MIKLLFAAFGTLGFGLLFHAKKNKLVYIMIGGFLNYLGYSFIYRYTSNIFLSSLGCAVVTSIYSNIMAIVLKCPSTVFILTGLIPIVPGSSLFYMMQGFVLKNYDLAKLNFGITCEVILGIVAGMALSTVVVTFIREFIKHMKTIHKNC